MINERYRYWFNESASTIATVFVIFVIVVIIIMSFFPDLLRDNGTIEGVFISGETEGFGDFCGQYPFTMIKLRNYSIEGNYNHWGGNKFYFGNQWNQISDFKEGDYLRIDWHETSRPADASPGEMIDYYVIDRINKI